MIELIAGLLAGIWIGMAWGYEPSGAAVFGGITAIGLYFLSCAVFPYRTCWWCKGDRKHDDGRGNFRIKRPCWWCGSLKFNRRVGARLIGRG